MLPGRPGCDAIGRRGGRRAMAQQLQHPCPQLDVGILDLGRGLPGHALDQGRIDVAAVDHAQSQQTLIKRQRAVDVGHRDGHMVDPQRGRASAQPGRHQVAAGHVVQRLAAAHQLGLAAADQHRRRPRHRVEVSRQRLFVGAGGEERDHVAGGDLRGQRRAGGDGIEAAADAGHVDQRGRTGQRRHRQRLPAGMLPGGIGQIHLRAVAADPGARRRRRLPLHVQHRRQVQTGVPVDGAAGLDLERDPVRIDAAVAQRVGQRRADGAGVRGRGGGVIPGRPQGKAGGIAGERVAAADVDLAGYPAVQRLVQLRHQTGQTAWACSRNGSTGGGVAAQVRVHAGQLDAVQIDGGKRHQQLVDGDARLVGVGQLAQRRRLGELAGGGEVAEVGPQPQPYHRHGSQLAGDRSRIGQLLDAVDGHAGTGRDRRGRAARQAWWSR